MVQPIRQYITAELKGELRAAYIRGDVEFLDSFFRRQLGGQGNFRITALPSRDIRPVFPDPPDRPPDQYQQPGGDASYRPQQRPAPLSQRASRIPIEVQRRLATLPDQLVIALTVDDQRILGALREKVLPALGRTALLNADLPLRAADHWCPGQGTLPFFGTRRDAELLTGADQLRAGGANLDGDEVNVVVVDEGVDRSLVPDVNWAGGWTVDWPPAEPGGWVGTRWPGTAHLGHGAMITRNILQLAPRASILDFPLLPEAIRNVGSFLNLAQAQYDRLRHSIRIYRETNTASDRWVIVNAWGVYDSRTEVPPGSYSRDSGFKHGFNVAVRRLARLGVDIVFAAGNCGQFCPNPRCGPDDRGPGNSVLGANSHPSVLSVGVVRTDGLWLGYSSQGPGAPSSGVGTPGHDKPDLCAPGQFTENDDAGAEGSNTGTSAACAFAAGVTAALRSEWGPGQISPERLRQVFRRTAMHDGGKRWRQRLGWGILDIPTAIAKIPQASARGGAATDAS